MAITNIEKRLKWQNEIKEFIKTTDMEDIFKMDNEFYNKYNCNLYIYLRVSTEEQDFGRQLIELYNWAKKKNITIYIKNIYFDKFTGKKITRDGYQELKINIKSGDYIATTNLNRLGRNWDDIKREWYEFEINRINRIILDNDNLSVELPNEKHEEMTINRKFIQDISFSAVLYSACQKIQEVSDSTKDGMKKARSKGKRIGRPAGNNSNYKNFVKTLKYQFEDNLTSSEALEKSKMTRPTYFVWLRKYKEKYNINDTKKLYEILKKEL